MRLFRPRVQPRLTEPGNYVEHVFPKREPTPLDQLQLMGLIWATWNPAEPTNFAALSSSPALKGFNFAMWRDALTTRVLARGGNPASEIVETGSSVSLQGEVVIDLCSMLDRVVLGHWFPRSMIEAIKARSTAPSGTRVYFWADYESLPQNSYWNPAAESIRAVLRQWPLSSSTVNSYGCTAIDKYELINPRGPGQVACTHSPPHAGLPPNSDGSVFHSWDLDVFQPATDEFDLDVLVAAYRTAVQSYLVAGKFVFDGWFFDNVLTFPFKGTATNGYATDWATKYVAGWRAFLERWSNGAYLPEYPVQAHVLWGNSVPDVLTYTQAQLPGRYMEHVFRKSPSVLKLWPEIETDLISIGNAGLDAVLALSGNLANEHIWALSTGGPNPATNGTWAQIATAVRSLQATQRIAVAAWQTFSDAYAFWQEGFREPT